MIRVEKGDKLHDGRCSFCRHEDGWKVYILSCDNGGGTEVRICTDCLEKLKKETL